MPGHRIGPIHTADATEQSSVNWTVTLNLFGVRPHRMQRIWGLHSANFYTCRTCRSLHVCVQGTPEDCAKTDEPRSCAGLVAHSCGPKKPYNTVHIVMHHLSNTIERSVRGGDASCRYHTITVTTC